MTVMKPTHSTAMMLMGLLMAPSENGPATMWHMQLRWRHRIWRL